MKFEYEAKNAEGNIVKGVEEVESKLDLYKHLQEQNLLLVHAEEKSEKSIFSRKDIVLFKRVSVHQQITFARNLSVMLDAGLSLSRALTIMGKQTKNVYFKKILDSIENAIRGGKTFHESLALYPKIFSNLFVSMVAAGEESGKLSESLNVISGQMEKNYTLMKKVKGALIYPAVIICAMIGIGIFMLIYVVPTLTATFADLNVELPVSTQFIIWLSSSLQNHAIASLFIVALVVTVSVLSFKSNRGKKIYNYLILRIPIIGNLIKEVNAARTSRTLSSLLTSGVSVVDSLRITRDVLQNNYYKDVIAEAEKQVQLGSPISGVFSAASNIYPLYVGEMMAVGEETGELGTMLVKVAQFFEDEVEQATKDMSTVIEPFLMIIVGIAVGFFAISMITPMYSLVDSI